MVGKREPYIRVSPCAARVTVSMHWGCNVPEGPIALYMRRLGEPADFAMYPPLEVNGGQLLFQFDDLLFSREQGRYAGRLLVGVTEYATLQFEYRDAATILNVETP